MLEFQKLLHTTYKVVSVDEVARGRMGMAGRAEQRRPQIGAVLAGTDPSWRRAKWLGDDNVALAIRSGRWIPLAAATA